MESIDDLLSQIKTEYQEKDLGIKPKKEPLLKEEELQSPQPFSSRHQPQFLQKQVLSSAEESLLAEVKAEFEEKAKAEELRRQEQLKEEQRQKEQKLREEQLQVEQRRKRKREVLAKEANEWLSQLNPSSEEGLWFEEFSYSYPSKLEAAIDYLEALRETHR